MTISVDRPGPATPTTSRRRLAGHRPPSQPRRDLGTDVDHVQRWAARMQAAGLSQRTIRERTRLVRAIALASVREPHRLTEDDVVAYLNRVPAAASKNAYWGTLRAWHDWVLAEGLRRDDPLARLARPRVPRRRPRPVSTGQLRAVLGARMHARTRAMVLLAALAGLRAHEVAKVRGEDFDVLGGTLTVLGKGGVLDVLPLHPTLLAEARLWPTRGWWFPAYDGQDRPVREASVSRVVALAMRRAGVQGTAHQLRHWYGTELLARGADARTVQTLMRHASLATTALYTEVADSRRAAAIERLPGDLLQGAEVLW